MMGEYESFLQLFFAQPKELRAKYFINNRPVTRNKQITEAFEPVTYLRGKTDHRICCHMALITQN